MTTTMPRRIALLTGGGDAPGLNAVIRAVTKTAITKYEWSVCGFEDGFEGCITGRFHELTLDSVRGILPRGGTILGASNRCNPFSYANPDAGEQEPRDHSADVIQRLRDLEIDGLIVIGGDGTLSIAGELNQLGVPAVGIPKTIDNDIRGTEVTFGFDSAVVTATEALDKLHTTAESHHRVMIVEVMGRTAGWIALYAGVAGGADVILMPEIPFEVEHVCKKIEHRASLGRRFTVIVISEAATPPGGEAIYEQTGHLHYQRRYGGVGEWLRRELASRVKQEVRAVTLGHLQRGGTPTARDRALGTMLGSAAVDMMARGQTGQMVAVAGETGSRGRPVVVPIPLTEPGRGPRHVPLNHPLLVAAREMGISFGDDHNLTTKQAT